MTPYRTGIPTILRLLKKICSLLITYGDVIRLVVPADKHVYVDALMKACEDFTANIQHPRA